MLNNTSCNLPEMMSAKDLMKFLPISRSSIYALLRDPTFPTIRLGQRIIVPRDEMLRWLDQNLHRNDLCETGSMGQKMAE